MASLKKQTFWNAVLTYLGVILGGINNLILFPLFLRTEEIGLLRLVQSLAHIYNQFALIGIQGIIIRYAPEHADPRRQEAFAGWLHLVALTGSLLTTVAYILGRPWILQAYRSGSGLFEPYYLYVIPFSVVTTFYILYEVYAAVEQRTLRSSFFRELFQRGGISLLVILYAMSWITFPMYMYGFLVLQVLMMILLLAGLGVRHHLGAWLRRPHLDLPRQKAMLEYGLYAMLSGGTLLIVVNIDSIMLGAIQDLSILGVYAVYLSLAALVHIPTRVLIKVYFPIIAKAWVDQRLDDLAQLYRRTALIQMILSLWVFGGVYINEHNLYYVLQNPAYHGEFLIFVFLAASYIFDASFGFGQNIISTSPGFRINLYIHLLMVGVTALTNYLLIPVWGGKGAALATALSVLFINILRWAFVRFRYGMEPFTLRHLKGLVLFGVCLAVGRGLPAFTPFVLDLLFRSLVFTGLYFGLGWWVGLFADYEGWIRQTARQQLRRWTKR